MRLVAALLASLALTSPAAAAPIPKVRTTADKLLGHWKLVKSSKGSEMRVYLEIEFIRDGKMLLRHRGRGEQVPLFLREGKYKVEGEKIHYEVSTPGYQKAETLTIRRLTDDELAFDDPDGVREEFVRIYPDRKDKK